MNYFAEIRHAIRRMHGCESEHVYTLPVTEFSEGQVVWRGQVEVFDLTGHPKAKRAYAWGTRNGRGELEAEILLEIPPVESPQTAVRAAIAAQTKKSGAIGSGRVFGGGAGPGGRVTDDKID